MKKIILVMFLVVVNCFLMSCVVSSSSPLKAKDSQNLAANYNVQLGLAYLQKGETGLAKEKLLLALQESPKWPVAQDAMGYFEEVTGDPLNAQKYYQKAVSLSPNDGAALNNYGVFLCREHKQQLAERMFLKAVNQVDYLNSAEAYENAGLCALTIPDRSKAAYYFRNALKQDPHRTVSALALENLNG